MEAKIIEPTTGASTWALGNHRWAKKIGSFTRKAKTALSRKKELLKLNLNLNLNCLIYITSLNKIFIIKISKGIEAETV